MQHPEQLKEQQTMDALEQDATLVTVNRRLAAYTMDRYAQRQINKGYAAWKAPDILPYHAWLERCLEQKLINIEPKDVPAGSKDDPVLLSFFQELILWKRIIASDTLQQTLLQTGAAAHSAGQAWRLCIEWRVPIDSCPAWDPVDAAAFARWTKEFDRQCKNENRLDRARLADAVKDAALQESLDITGPVIFSGFDDFTPQTNDLMDALASKHIDVYIQIFPALAGKAVKAPFPDEAMEMKAAAEWARKTLEKNPGKRIGVIINGLGQSRDTVCRIFDETLYPSSMISQQLIDRPAYNISLGRPLSDYPLVKNALSILSMADENPDMATISAVLLSPFITGAQSEMPLRAAADKTLWKSRQPRLSALQVLAILETGDTGSGAKAFICPTWCRSLERFEAMCIDMPESQAPAGWCDTFSQLLGAFGFPGDRALDSHEYQALSAWQDVLVRFAGTSGVTPVLSFAEASGLLIFLLEETLFQPETENVNLQIMGLLEASGEAFDFIWITGLTSENWPPPPASNPFIPVSLQKKHGLPHATAARELEFARKVTRRLIASADEAIVSFPVSFGDTPLFPSSIISHLPDTGFTPAPAGPADYRVLMARSGELEECSDIKGPPIHTDTTIAGGTGIVRAQSACPFRAFVQYRLGAEPPENPVSGIDAADRGILVHHVLKQVWKILNDQRNLETKKDEELAAIVSAAVDDAVFSMAKKRPQTFTGRFADIERQRLCELALHWLQQDRKRRFFKVIKKEQRLVVNVGPIRLNTYADRIDLLENGRPVIIDYKTGEVSIQNWFSGRIAEPQLPLYCLALDAPPAGVFFARVKKGDMKYVGIADEEAIVEGIKSVADTGGLNQRFAGIADIVDYWKAQLESIAEELAAGHAPVSPVSMNKNCRFCHLHTVCRIHEAVE